MDKRHALAVFTGIASLAMLLHAEEPTTVGFWTFDGESGVSVAETRDEQTFPNRIIDSAPRLALCYVGPKAPTVPLATYTNDIQHAHLYGDRSCANRLASTATSLHMKSLRGSASAPYYGTSHPCLVVTNLGEVVRARSFTLEFIAKSYMPLDAGWTSFLSLNQNELGTSPLTVQTSSAFQLRVRVRDGSTEKSSLNTAFVGMDYNHWIDDGKWHHFAVRWTQASKTLEIFTDYALARSYTLTNYDLLLSTDSYFSLFPYSSGGYNHEDVFVQAIRLTAGDLDQGSFLQTSPHQTPQTTMAHYRFEGVAGEDLVEARNVILDRADLALFRANVQSTPPGTAPATPTLFETQSYPFLKVGQDYLANETGVRDNSGNSSHLRLSMRNPSYLLPKSFTHEFLVKPALQVLSGGSKILGELNGPNTDTSNANAAWYMAQRNNTAYAGLANFQVYIRVWNGTMAANRTHSIYLATNEWHHVALTYDNTSRVFKIYRDGVEQKKWELADGEELVRGTAFSPPVGNSAFNQNYGYVGSFDEYRVSNVALEPGQFLKMKRTGGGVLVIIR